MELVQYLRQYLRGTRAIAAMEYAIIVGVVVVGVGVGMSALDIQVKDYLFQITREISSMRFSLPRIT